MDSGQGCSIVSKNGEEGGSSMSFGFNWFLVIVKDSLVLSLYCFSLLLSEQVFRVIATRKERRTQAWLMFLLL